jgi:hypothetical protein
VTTWTHQDLQRIGSAEELQLASRRPDETLRPYTTMWVVRVDDDLYVRSAYGPEILGFAAPRPAASAASGPGVPNET